jgi:hypothetical protein
MKSLSAVTMMAVSKVNGNADWHKSPESPHQSPTNGASSQFLTIEHGNAQWPFVALRRPP